MKTVSSKVSPIVDYIVEKYQPKQVILFGSYAWGNPQRDSDLDLLIIKDTNDNPIDRRVTLRSLLADLRSPIPFDLLVVTPEELKHHTLAGNSFLRQIIESGITLYVA